MTPPDMPAGWFANRWTRCAHYLNQGIGPTLCGEWRRGTDSFTWTPLDRCATRVKKCKKCERRIIAQLDKTHARTAQLNKAPDG